MSDATHMFAIGPCLVCDKPFAFNPDHVPSLRFNRATGQADPHCAREPICRECMEAGNRQRVREGKPEHPIHPNAYEPQEV